MRELNIDRLLPANSVLGDQATSQACVLARNRTGILTVHMTMPNQLDPHCQGGTVGFLMK